VGTLKVLGWTSCSASSPIIRSVYNLTWNPATLLKKVDFTAICGLTSRIACASGRLVMEMFYDNI
jgi:hypothetical protein